MSEINRLIAQGANVAAPMQAYQQGMNDRRSNRLADLQLNQAEYEVSPEARGIKNKIFDIDLKAKVAALSNEERKAATEKAERFGQIAYAADTPEKLEIAKRIALEEGLSTPEKLQQLTPESWFAGGGRDMAISSSRQMKDILSTKLDREKFDFERTKLNETIRHNKADEGKQRYVDENKAPETKVVTSDDGLGQYLMQYDPATKSWKKANMEGQGGSGAIDLQSAISMARSEASDKAGYFSGDAEDFGGSKEEWINKRALELMGSKKEAGSKMPTSSPHQDGTRLRGRDGNAYVVRNGVPVLEGK